MELCYRVVVGRNGSGCIYSHFGGAHSYCTECAEQLAAARVLEAYIKAFSNWTDISTCTLEIFEKVLVT